MESGTRGAPPVDLRVRARTDGEEEPRRNRSSCSGAACAATGCGPHRSRAKIRPRPPAVNPFPTTIFPRVSAPLPGRFASVSRGRSPFGSARIRGHCARPLAHQGERRRGGKNGRGPQGVAPIGEGIRGTIPTASGEGCEVGARGKEQESRSEECGPRSGESIDGPRPMPRPSGSLPPASLPSSFRALPSALCTQALCTSTSPRPTPSPVRRRARRLDAVTTRSRDPDERARRRCWS